MQPSAAMESSFSAKSFTELSHNPHTRSDHHFSQLPSNKWHMAAGRLSIDGRGSSPVSLTGRHRSLSRESSSDMLATHSKSPSCESPLDQSIPGRGSLTTTRMSLSDITALTSTHPALQSRHSYLPRSVEEALREDAILEV